MSRDIFMSILWTVIAVVYLLTAVRVYRKMIVILETVIEEEYRSSPTSIIMRMRWKAKIIIAGASCIWPVMAIHKFVLDRISK